MYLADIVAVINVGQVSVRYYFLDILPYFKVVSAEDSFLTRKDLELAFGVGFQFVG